MTMESSAVSVMEKALAFSYRRHEVILNNIANVSTPGYRTQDLPVENFSAALRKAMSPPQAPTVLGRDPFPLIVYPEPNLDSPDFYAPVPSGGMPGPDGNDVVPELEAAKLAKNATLFSALSQLLSRNFNMMESAIRERV